MKNSNKLYLAYGSNLNLGQMGFRCPYAIPLGVSTLSGYRLLFRGGNNGNAVATVEPDENGSVPVLIWEITPRDEEALDRYEGWPRLYRKETVTVSLNGKSVEVMVYIMNEIYPMGTPSEHYLNVITEGYASAGFDTAALDEAVRVSTPNKRSNEQYNDCLACSHSHSEPAEIDGNPDRLFCMERQEYVEEDGFCEEFN